MGYSQHEILVTGLKNAYALEAHAADVTQNQAGRLGDYPELQRRVQQHHEETLRQRDRLGECLSQPDVDFSRFNSALARMNFFEAASSVVRVVAASSSRSASRSAFCQNLRSKAAM